MFCSNNQCMRYSVTQGPACLLELTTTQLYGEPMNNIQLYKCINGQVLLTTTEQNSKTYRTIICNISNQTPLGET